MNLLNQILSGRYAAGQTEPAAASRPGAPASADFSSGTPTPTPGELLRGEVVDLRLNRISLRLEDGSMLSARTDGSLPLVIGQKAGFAVSRTSDNQIVLKLAQSGENATEAVIGQALQAAGITRTDRAAEVVTELLRHQQPVSAKTLRHYHQLSVRYPELPVRDLLLMELHRIPVNSENVQQFLNCNQGIHRLTEQTEALIDRLWEQLSALPEPEADHFFRELVSLLPAEASFGTKTAFTPFAAPEATAENASVFSGEAVLPADVSPSEDAFSEIVSSEDVLSGDIPSEDAVSPDAAPRNAASGATASAAPEARVPESAEEFRQLFHRFLLLQPEQLAKPDAVKQVYKNLEATVSRLARLAEANGAAEEKEGHSLSSFATLKQSFSFLEAVNQVFPYLQLPLLLQEQPAHGELYVYEKKRTLSPEEPFRCLLHLSLEALGTTDIFLVLTGHSVSARFMMSDKEAETLVKKELPVLSKALSEKGFALQSEVCLLDQQKENDSPLEQFLEAHSPSGLCRYSFDIRA